MVRQIVIDTETTGLDPYKGNHRIIEIALIEVIDNVITGKKFHSYFDPQGRGSTKGAFNVHKLKDNFLVGKPLFSNELSKIVKFINNDDIIFYNKIFDLKFLDLESLLHGSETVFSRDYKSICLMEAVTKKLGRRISTWIMPVPLTTLIFPKDQFMAH